MPALAQLGGVTLDCPDPVALAEFYRTATGWQVVFSNDDFVYLAADAGSEAFQLQLGFQRVPEQQAPPWPSPARQVHLGLAATELDESEKRLLELGATKPDAQPGGDQYRVLTDPAGHPFYLFAW